MTPRPWINKKNTETKRLGVIELRPSSKLRKKIDRAYNRMSTYEYSVSIELFQTNCGEPLTNVDDWSNEFKRLISKIMETAECMQSTQGCVMNIAHYVAALRNLDLPRLVPQSGFLAVLDVQKPTPYSMTCNVVANSNCAEVIRAILIKDIELAYELLGSNHPKTPRKQLGIKVGVAALIYALEQGHRTEDIPNTKYQIDVTIGADYTQDMELIAKYRRISADFRKQLPVYEIAFDGPREEQTGDRSRSITWTKLLSYSEPSVKLPASKPRLSWGMSFQGMGPAKAENDILNACLDRIPVLLKDICIQHGVDKDSLKFAPLIGNHGVPQFLDQIV